MTMETVYAIHSFEAENDDEIPFQVGEPILVLEKDDLYGDSWWRGKNIHGQVGLFPMTYISYEPSPVNVPSLSTSNDSTRENLQPATPTSALNMHGSDLDLPLPSFRMPSPSIDETIDDIHDKLQRMAVRTEEQVYQNKINQHHHPWAPKNGYSSRLFITSSSGSSTTSSRLSSTGKQHSFPHSPFDPDITKKVTTSVEKQTIEHPTDWDVNQVCKWLSDKGFESEIHHFADNDITGDILIGLNLSTLLKELNISSFGKRVHIMNAITELKNQFSFSNENNENNENNEYDDASDFEEYHHTQAASYPEPLVINTQSSLYSSRTMNSSVNLHKYGAASNISLPQINTALSFPKHIMDSPRTSTPNLTKNFPPTYYTYSQRLDDAEGANIEFIQKPSNKKEKLLAKLKNYKKDRTRSTGVLDYNKDRVSYVGSYPKRSIENNNHCSDDNGDMDEETLQSIGEPDYEGWLKKQGSKGMKAWKSWYCILKGATLYYFKNDKEIEPTDAKGRINLNGYRIIPDENLLHGKYGFKLVHDSGGSHHFAHDDADKVRDWMKSMMKSTIARDSRAPVISSSNISTISLLEARKLTPRPPDSRGPVNSTAINVASSPIIRPNVASSPITRSNVASSPIIRPNVASSPIIRPNIASSPIIRPNIASSPIIRPNTPQSQRAGSPIPTKPLSPKIQTIYSSSPLMESLNLNRATLDFL